MKTIKMPYNEYVDLKNKADDTMKKYKLVYKPELGYVNGMSLGCGSIVPIIEDKALDKANNENKKLERKLNNLQEIKCSLEKTIKNKEQEAVQYYILTTNLFRFISDKIKSMKLF